MKKVALGFGIGLLTVVGLLSTFSLGQALLMMFWFSILQGLGLVHFG